MPHDEPRTTRPAEMDVAERAIRDLSPWLRVQETLSAAKQLPADDIDAFLASLEDRDAQLHDAVTGLINLGVLEDPTVDLDSTEVAGQPMFAAKRWEGERLGSYRIESEIGRGGMGAVYLASRDDGEFDQRVALKVVGGGPLTGELHRRFLNERQILANLSHPGIARLLDGGTADVGSRSGGVPYLVMEFIEGVPMDKYCERHQLSIKERLRLFLQVCDAVAYAHRNLVVHRDLKPANILVTAAGTVKLLDFGIARLVDDSGRADATVGNPVLTVRYASPEQLTGGVVTTVSDIYCLGIVLYELLTGQHPFAGTGTSWEGIANRLDKDTIVVPPSRRVHSSEPTHGQHRLFAAWFRPFRHPAREIDPDVDRIVLKAITSRPEQRYGTASDLASDIRSYLNFEPISAVAPTWGYRLGKLMRRRRGPVIVAVLFLCSMVAGVVAREFEARRVEVAREQAEKARDGAEELASFMLDDLRFELEKIDRVGLLAPVAEKVQRYYEARADENLSPEERLRRAHAWQSVATVQSLEGDVQSIESFERSIEHARSVPDSQKAELIELSNLTALAMINSTTGGPSVLDRWRTVVERHQRALKKYPGDPEVLWLLVEAFDGYGIALFDHQQLMAALARFDEAQELARRTVAEEVAAQAARGGDSSDRDDSHRRTALAAIEFHRGATLEALERPQLASQAYGEAARDLYEVWRRHATSDSFVAMAAGVWANLETAIGSRDVEEALAILDAVLPAVRQLAASDPEHAETRYALAQALFGSATARRHAGRDDLARAQLEEIVELTKPFADSADHLYLLDVRVRALAELGHYAEALPAVEMLSDRDWVHLDFAEVAKRVRTGADEDS